MGNLELITQLKENNQDFEFYPTTNEIVAHIYRDIKNNSYGHNVLDIGAGNGSFFKTLDEISKKEDSREWESPFRKYAIEKSEILISLMPADVFVIGTDFHRQTLIDKKMGIIFCNPPYSEFEAWAAKIIKEANAEVVYLVIPCRWRDNKMLKAVIKQRGAKVKMLGSFDFLNAEFREARVKVDILKVVFECGIGSDPFNIWFEEFFRFNADANKYSEYDFAEKKKEEVSNALVKGCNIIERLEELYNADFTKLLNNYRAVEQLDYDVLKELNVNVEGLMESLKQRIEGLQNIYWQQLFNNLDTITNRLTTSSRKNLLDTLFRNTNVGFTASNAYAVVLWAIKNANAYMDKQLKDLYLWMAEPENIINYKSNTRTFSKERWRWHDENRTHYKLDYRLVFKCYRNFCPDKYGGYEYSNGLHRGTHDHINDIITIAKNIGFNVIDNSYSFEWTPGGRQTFYYRNGDKTKEFMQIRAYQNGNIHCKFCLEFSKALNVEAARLFKWVSNPQEAAAELDMPLNEVTQYYFKHDSAKIEGKNIKLLAMN